MRRWSRNIIFGVINRLLAPIILVPLAIYVANNNFWQRPDLLFNKQASFVIDLLLLDFTCYIFHRLCHKTPLLWRLHEIHHLDEAFDSTTGLRVHFMELVIQNIFTAIPVVIFVIPAKSIVLYTTLLGMFAFVQHSNIRFSKRCEDIMSFFLVTAKLHAVHHHAYIKDTDSNYGFIFSWWDRIFKTFNSTSREKSWRMGLEYSCDLSCVNLLLSPFKLRPPRGRSFFPKGDFNG